MELPKIEDRQGTILPKLLRRVFDDVIPRVRTQNFDYVGVISGLVGGGKSTLARGCAYYCDKTFNLDRICFTADEFIRITNEAKPFSAVVYDEVFESLNSRTSMTSDYRRIINHLNIIRRKNLFIFLVLPNIWDLTKNVAIFRANHLFVCYLGKEGERGCCAVYDRETKRILYMKGSKYLNYNCVKPNFRCRFYRNAWIIDEEAYEKKKNDCLVARELELQKKGTTKAKQEPDNFDKLIISSFKEGLERKEIAKKVGLSYPAIKERIIQYKKRGWL